MSALRRLSARVEIAAASLERRYLASVAIGGECICVDPDGVQLDAAQVQAALGYARSPVLIVYWISDAICIGLLPFVHRTFADVARSVRFLYDDTFWGRVCAQFHDRLGGSYTVLARHGDAARLADLREVLRVRRSYALAVDGGGPYRHVRSGLASLGKTLDAAIVPIAVRASRAMPVARRSGVRVPLPGCRVAVAIGHSISARAIGARDVTSGRVGSALDGLGSVAARALVSAPEERRWPQVPAVNRR